MFLAPDGSPALAVSGTGTTAMETAVANLVAPGTRVLSIVTGYFAERLAEICRRYGAAVRRIDVEVGTRSRPRCRPPPPARRGASRYRHRCPRRDINRGVEPREGDCRRGPRSGRVDDRRCGDLAGRDASGRRGLATGRGLQLQSEGRWRAFWCRTLLLAPRALARRVPCRSFALDLTLLEDYWLRRKYHRTLCASLIYALREALVAIEKRVCRRGGPATSGIISCSQADSRLRDSRSCHPPGERLWTLNAVRVPDGVDEAAVRRQMLQRFNIEIGAGLGPRRPHLAHRPDGREFDRSAGDTCLSALTQSMHLGSFGDSQSDFSSRRGARVAASCASGKSIRSRDVVLVLLERS